MIFIYTNPKTERTVLPPQRLLDTRNPARKRRCGQHKARPPKGMYSCSSRTAFAQNIHRLTLMFLQISHPTRRCEQTLGTRPNEHRAEDGRRRRTRPHADNAFERRRVRALTTRKTISESSPSRPGLLCVKVECSERFASSRLSRRSTWRQAEELLQSQMCSLKLRLARLCSSTHTRSRRSL